jgi:hypothetical protein
MSFEYVGTDGKKGLISLNKGELAFTFCQVPVVYASAGPENIVVHYVGGSTETVTGHTLSPQISSLIFQRTGRVEQLRVFVNTKG